MQTINKEKCVNAYVELNVTAKAADATERRDHVYCGRFQGTANTPRGQLISSHVGEWLEQRVLWIAGW